MQASIFLIEKYAFDDGQGLEVAMSTLGSGRTIAFDQETFDPKIFGIDGGDQVGILMLERS